MMCHYHINNFVFQAHYWRHSPETVFKNCTVQKIYGWTNITQAWMNTSAQMGQQLGQEDIDQTIVVKVASECTLSGVSTQPPTLP